MVSGLKYYKDGKYIYAQVSNSIPAANGQLAIQSILRLVGDAEHKDLVWIEIESKCVDGSSSSTVKFRLTQHLAKLVMNGMANFLRPPEKDDESCTGP